MPDVHLAERVMLQDYDAWGYAHHHERELPILRAVFDDDARTSSYIQPSHQ
jgi:hypothetical protein